MLKFIHCADIHLDSPFRGIDAERANVRRSELRGAFSSLMTFARMNAVQLILIAGDLFDCEFVTKETIALLNREFAASPDCRIVIAPGNHDPYTDSGAYSRCEFPDNVHIFGRDGLEKLELPELNTDIYGYAFRSSELMQNPVRGVRPDNPERINLLCAHCMLTTGQSDAAPIAPAELAACGFDYAALGHIHAATIEKTPDGRAYGYSGCLEGRDFGERGHKGAICVELEKSGRSPAIEMKFQRFSKRRYEWEELDVTGARSNADISERLRALIAEKRYGEDTILRVTLNGAVSPELELESGLLSRDNSAGLFSLEIDDKTLPVFDEQALLDDPTVKGALYRRMRPMLTSDDPEQRELAAGAFRYAMAALCGIKQ